MLSIRYFKIIAILVIGLVLLVSLLPAPKVKALDPPNYSSYLIDDAIFRNSSTMNPGSIQALLAGEGSGLANFSDIENCGPTSGSHYSFYASYYSCGNLEPAAQIIYDASRAYGINPQAVIATLQKEQSLITTPNPTSSQLDFAMGYGCPDSGGCGSVSGFFNQVDNGTWQFRTDMELGLGNNWWGYAPSDYVCKNPTRYFNAGLLVGNNVTFSDDNGTPYNAFVLPDMSTATLYCYTPHVYNNPNGINGLPQYGYTGDYYTGSYNFVYYFTLWFGSTISGVSVAQANGVGGLWAIYGGEKQLIASPTVEKAWGLFTLPVTTMDPNALNAMPARPVLTLLALNPFSSQGNPAYMVADQGGTFDALPSVVSDWGMNPASASAIGPELVAYTYRLGNLSIFVSTPGTSGIYLVDDGAIHGFPSPNVFNMWGGSNPTVDSLSSALFSSLTSSTAIVGNDVTNNSNSYFIDNGGLFSLTGIMNYAYPTTNQLNISSQLFSSLPDLGNPTRLVSSQGVPGIFLMDNGERLPLASPSLLQSYLANGETRSITQLSQAGINSIPVGQAITNRYVYDLSTPSKTYYMNNTLQVLPAQLTGTASYGIGLSDRTISWLGQPSGSMCNSNFVSGSSGHTGIFLLDNGQVRPIANYVEYQLLNPNLSNECVIPQEDFSVIPVGSAVTPLVTVGGNNYLIDNGNYFNVNAAAQQGWNFTSFTTLDSGGLNLFSNGGNLSNSFFVNGNYYFVSDGNFFTTTNPTVAQLWSASYSNSLTGNVVGYIHYAGQLSQFAHSNNNSHPGIYLVDQVKFIGITNPDDFFNAGYTNQNIVGVDDSYLTANTAVSPWQGYLASDATSGNIYVLEGGNKHLVPSQLQAQWLGSPQTITPTIFSSGFLSLLNTGSNVTNSFASPDIQGIYGMSNGSKFVIPNYSEYSQSYAPYLGVSDHLVNAVP